MSGCRSSTMIGVLGVCYFVPEFYCCLVVFDSWINHAYANYIHWTFREKNAVDCYIEAIFQWWIEWWPLYVTCRNALRKTHADAIAFQHATDIVNFSYIAAATKFTLYDLMVLKFHRHLLLDPYPLMKLIPRLASCQTLKYCIKRSDLERIFVIFMKVQLPLYENESQVILKIILSVSFDSTTYVSSYLNRFDFSIGLEFWVTV